MSDRFKSKWVAGAKARLSNQPVAAEEAAEKGLNLSEILEKHPAGAESHPLLSASCGTTKVVPLLQNLPELSFSAACKAHSFLSAFCGTTEEAAEKGLNLSEILEKHPAGAEAHPLLSASCGPTEVVPLLQNLPELSFSAASSGPGLKARLPKPRFRGINAPAPSEKPPAGVSRE